MINNTEFKTIQFKRGVKSVLEAKLTQSQLGIPKAGEPIYETDTGRLKIGDGKTAYKDLTYLGEKEDLDLKTFEFESESDIVVNGILYHVLWLATPTSTNSVQGFTICQQTGKLYEVYSTEKKYALKAYITDSDIIQTEDIDNLFKSIALN